MAKNNSKTKPKKRKAVFLLSAPQATEVYLVGDFNDWNGKKHPLKKNPDGVWEKITFLPSGRYEYKFVVDDNWLLDQTNPNTVVTAVSITGRNLVLPPLISASRRDNPSRCRRVST